MGGLANIAISGFGNGGVGHLDILSFSLAVGFHFAAIVAKFAVAALDHWLKPVVAKLAALA